MPVTFRHWSILNLISAAMSCVLVILALYFRTGMTVVWGQRMIYVSPRTVFITIAAILVSIFAAILFREDLRK